LDAVASITEFRRFRAITFASCWAPPSRGDFDRLIRMGWIVEYLRNVYTELEKVNWPTREELINSTLVTLIATIIISGFIFIADQAISEALNLIYQ
jgi:preprotein translocase subunit SecE